MLTTCLIIASNALHNDNIVLKIIASNVESNMSLQGTIVGRKIKDIKEACFEYIQSHYDSTHIHTFLMFVNPSQTGADQIP